MRHILVIGAGRSASSLIKYLLDHSEKEQLHITIGDLSIELAQQKTNNHKNARAISFDVCNDEQRKKEIQQA
ncbi:MAG: saccharopine dehydrogenase NADP-binding domain-containing protein, partial [Flavobacterium sp.]